MTRPTRSFVTTFTCPVTSSTFPVYVSSALMTFVAYSRQARRRDRDRRGRVRRGHDLRFRLRFRHVRQHENPEAGDDHAQGVDDHAGDRHPLAVVRAPASRPIPPSTTPTAPPTRDREPMHGMKLRSSEMTPPISDRTPRTLVESWGVSRTGRRRPLPAPAGPAGAVVVAVARPAGAVVVSAFVVRVRACHRNILGVGLIKIPAAAAGCTVKPLPPIPPPAAAAPSPAGVRSRRGTPRGTPAAGGRPGSRCRR